MVPLEAVTPKERKRAVQEYVRERLRAEVRDGERGTQAAIAGALGVKPPHLSNILATPPTRHPGEDFRAAAWPSSCATKNRRYGAARPARTEMRSRPCMVNDTAGARCVAGAWITASAPSQRRARAIGASALPGSSPSRR